MIPLAQPPGPSSGSPAARAVRRAAAAPLPVESEEAFAAALSAFALDARGLADLDEAEWHALAVRALGAGGAPTAAAPPAGDADRAARVVAVVRSPPLRRLARRGIVRPVVRHPSAPAGAWAVNVDRLCEGAGPLELGVRRTLGEVLAELSRVWSGRDPRPALALDGLGRLARRMAGPRAGPARVRRAAEEVRRFCAEELGRHGADLGWSRAPDVLRLDLAG